MKLENKKTSVIANILKFLRWISPPLIVILAIWGFWEAAYKWEWLNLTFFPPPSKFIAYIIDQQFTLGLGEQRSNIGFSILSSFWRVGCGLTFALICAFIVGCAAATSSAGSRTLIPLVRLMAPIAPIAWIPLAIALFGLGNKTAITLVFLGTFPVLVIATVAAIRQVDPELIRTAESLGAKRFQLWFHVMIPAALPSVFTMLRINFIAAWMAVLAAEMVGSRDGLGAIILLGREAANPSLALAGMALIAITGFTIDQILLIVQKKYLWWSQDVKL